MAENLEKKAPNVRFKGFTDVWEQRKLGEVLEEKNIRLGNGDLLSVTLGKGVVKASELDRKDNSSSDKSKYKMVEKKDIVYNTMRMWQGALGISKYSGIVSPAYTVLSSKNKFDPHFISILFKQSKMIYLFGAYSQGLTSDTWTLKYNSLSKIVAKFPSFDEQVKIYSIFDRLNTLITLYQRKIGLLQQLKKAMLQRLFPDTDTYPKLRFDGFSDPWEQHKLGEVTTSYSGGTPKAGEEKYYSGNIPFIRSAEINSSTTELFISELGLNSSSAKLVSKGMILYALYGATSGEVGISKIDGAINQAILALTPVEKYDSIFISQYLKLIKGKIVQKYLQGGQGNLSASIVKNIDIKFPDCDEQLKISQFLTKFDTLITLQQHKLDNMHELKKFMLQNLFL